MKLGKALLGTVGAAGAAALANRHLRSRASEFEPFLDGDQGTYRWRGFDIGYAEFGDPADPDALLLHGPGLAASGHEFHGIAAPLSDDYHVLVPDLPGFGHSDRPPMLYSASLYETFVADAVADLTDDPLVVASSLTGAHAAAAVREVAVDRLVLVCPTGDTGERRPWLRGLVRSPLAGEAAFNLLTSRGALRYVGADRDYYDPEAVPDEVLAYEWQTAHQPGARFAPAAFLAGFLDPETPLDELLSAVETPVTLVWGRNSDRSPLAEGRTLAETADTDLVVFDRAKLLPHAEYPGEFLGVLRDELAAES